MSKSKVPQIRFKGFSGEWNNENLGKLANFSKGQGYSKNDLVEDGKPIILYGRLYTKYQAVISKVDTYVKEQQNSILSKGNEVVVPASGETAEDIARASAIKTPNLLIGGDLNIIYPNNEIDNSFLALNISNGRTQKNLSKKAQGKSVVHLRNNDLKEIDLFYPYKDEQIKISNYFQQLDILIEQKEKKYQKLKQFKKAMLDKMFPKNGANTPEIRFKGFSEKWEEKKLGELIEFIVDNRGKNPRYYCNEGIPVIDNFMIKNNYHPNLREATRFIDDNLFKNFIRKYVNPNDTIITLVGNGIGNITLVPKEKSVIIQNTLGLRFSNEKIFMFYCLLSKNKEIKHLDRGMAQPSIRQDELLDIEIKVPIDTKEQKKIGNYFQKLDKQIDLQQKELEKLKNIKKASLSKMFV
ncbi:restriction endonuclease subunit S [Aliarcobacter butzleri]